MVELRLNSFISTNINRITFYNDKIVISGRYLKRRFEDVILYTDVRRIVFNKIRWYQYLILYYTLYAGQVALFFKDNRREYDKIFLTNRQFKKVRKFIEYNKIDVEIRFR